jgi:tRNA pseudouridine38-40 synthase
VRLRLDLAYDGTDFNGWARQPSLRTVQGSLESALDLVLRAQAMRVTCAGRTDTGVHARGQVVHVDVEEDALVAAAARGRSAPVTALRRRLNGVLSSDIRVLRATIAAEGFDARYSAVWRRYAYRIADDPHLLDPLRRREVLGWFRPLNLDAMNEAALRLIGRHDFSAFCRKRVGATTIRTLHELHWSRDEAGLAVATVRADAFCHTMVRSLVGCLIAVGEGRHSPAWPREVLDGGERVADVTVVQPRGLTLEEVRYPPDDELAGWAWAARAKRTMAWQVTAGG